MVEIALGTRLCGCAALFKKNAGVLCLVRKTYTYCRMVLYKTGCYAALWLKNIENQGLYSLFMCYAALCLKSIALQDKTLRGITTKKH